MPLLTPFTRSATRSIKGTSTSPLVRSRLHSRAPLRFRYGAYHSKEHVADLVGPPADTLDLVHTWLIHHGIRPSISTSYGGCWLTVTNVDVSQENQLLDASYKVYRNLKTGHTTIRTFSYALHAVLYTIMETVAPTTYFPSTRGMRQTPRRRSSGAAPEQTQAASEKVVTARQIQQIPGITPSILRWLYGTGSYVLKVPYRNTLGILGIEDKYPSKRDLRWFM